MQKGTVLFVVAMVALAASSLFAQNYEVGAFAELFQLGTVNPTLNMVGMGGRAAMTVHPNVQFEAELGYDFPRDFLTPFNNGLTTAQVPSRMRTLTAIFGPKFQTNQGPIRAFVTLKVGVLDFNVSRVSVPAGFTAAVSRALNGGTAGVFYPGAGVELFKGSFGLRAEVGDEIYFDNGGNNNLRITVGPQFRF
jgi:hypothetical protein